MRVTYVGPMPEVFIPAHDEYLDIAHGDTVNVSTELGESLLGQNLVDEFAEHVACEVKPTTPIWLPADAEAEAFLAHIAECITWLDAVAQQEAVAAAAAAEQARADEAARRAKTAEEDALDLAFEQWSAENHARLLAEFEASQAPADAGPAAPVDPPVADATPEDPAT